ncbi:hemerythrin domain-containing protein [Maritimibacter sp. 55A14]|uniref:hemerythrin domain-containing protein n=1 Tax=Maritimibacter sp. 55A14 TaxID=2174844 RepID=UPI000D68EAE1|nr:hemerythrin domain-containing protein [Maritimibacter sp. 55A14]
MPDKEVWMIETVESLAPQPPTPTLIEHILVRYHETHRRELPELIALAQKVETVHANDIDAPHGLTQALEAMIADLEDHMRNEEAVVFPALDAGMSGQVDESISLLRDDHAGHEAALNRIAAITHGFRLPSHACGSWIRLYAGLGKLAEDLDEHRYLENDVLFPRFEPDI